MSKTIAIIGIVGLPAKYGGFETLVENLVRLNDATEIPFDITVYCSGVTYKEKKPSYFGANLKYVPLSANGVQSIPYDVWSLVRSLIHKPHSILVLGVSGAIALPFVRLISNVRIITNVDGIEWRRNKWKGIAKKFLKFSERLAVKFSHVVISDNAAIKEYIENQYGANSEVIAYGGDHAVTVECASIASYLLPPRFSLSVCRIEPENNIDMILSAFAELPDKPLVFVGNWDNSDYGRKLRERFGDYSNIRLLDPIYDLATLAALRSMAKFYVHGHSAGGTNPSLVEAMHFGLPIFAFDCSFSRYTTNNKAIFFKTTEDLRKLINNISSEAAIEAGKNMREIACSRYTWKVIAEKYFMLFNS